MVEIPYLDRLNIYRWALIKLHEPELVTICSAILHVIYHKIDKSLAKSLLDQKDISLSFPELLAYKPADAREIWFPITDEYRQKRIEIIYKIINP